MKTIEPIILDTQLGREKPATDAPKADRQVKEKSVFLGKLKNLQRNNDVEESSMEDPIDDDIHAMQYVWALLPEQWFQCDEEVVDMDEPEISEGNHFDYMIPQSTPLDDSFFEKSTKDDFKVVDIVAGQNTIDLSEGDLPEKILSDSDEDYMHSSSKVKGIFQEDEGTLLVDTNPRERSPGTIGENPRFDDDLFYDYPLPSHFEKVNLAPLTEDALREELTKEISIEVKPQVESEVVFVDRVAEVAEGEPGIKESLEDLDAQDILNQITREIHIDVKGREHEIKIRLKPDFLGDVLIKVSTDAGRLKAEFFVDNVQVRQALQGFTQDLKGIFEEKGLDFSQINVYGMLDGSEVGAGNHGFEGQDRQQYPHKNRYISLNTVDGDDVIERQYDLLADDSSVNYVI